MGAGLVPCCHTGQEPWADLLGAGTSRIKEPAYPFFISYETPSLLVTLRGVSSW